MDTTTRRKTDILGDTDRHVLAEIERLTPREDDPSSKLPLESKLELVGLALEARVEEIVARIVTSIDADGNATGSATPAIGRVARVSTIAVARWIAGASEDVARSVGWGAWEIFGDLAAERTAALDEITKGCLRWRDTTADVVREESLALGMTGEEISHVHDMLRRSTDVTIVRMTQQFEKQRRRIHDELEARQAELQYQASHDPLTGVLNRTSFDRALRGALDATADGRLSVFVLDLDDFKAVNDTLGHGCGDQLLAGIAERLLSAAGDGNVVARLGGDEFAILAPGDREVGEAMTGRLVGLFEQPFQLREIRLEAQASIGIAHAPDHGLDPDTLLRRADQAMYDAKRGNTKAAVYRMRGEDTTIGRRRLLGGLRAAIDGEQLCLHYQPKIDLRRRTVTGVEALVRWNHPQRGLLLPEEFVPGAEATGLIRRLTAWLIQRSILQLADWQGCGSDLGIAINISARDLEDTALATSVAAQLNDAGIPAERLTLELTERTVMQDRKRAVDLIARLRDSGIRVSLDDFGSGHSSLARLESLQVDEVKLDRLFLASGLSRPGTAIVKMATDLAHALGSTVVAEGVEDDHTLETLTTLGCDSAQGFLFAPGMPADELELWQRRTIGRSRVSGIAGSAAG